MQNPQKTEPRTTRLSEDKIFQIGKLSRAGEDLIFYFRTSDSYRGGELEELLNIVSIRGADCQYLGNERFRMRVPAEFFWVPFYKTVKDCKSAKLTRVSAVNTDQIVTLDEHSTE